MTVRLNIGALSPGFGASPGPYLCGDTLQKAGAHCRARDHWVVGDRTVRIDIGPDAAETLAHAVVMPGTSPGATWIG